MSVLSAGSLAAACRAKRGGVVVDYHCLTAAQVRLHVDVLGKRFDFVHHDDLPERLARPGRRPFCLLTFDDGKRSNAAEAAPELRRLGVPAVFYVTTRFVGGGPMLWFDRHAAIRRALGAVPAGLELATLKELPLDLLEARLDRACAEHGVAPEPASDDERPMSWDDARGLARQGFTVGAHGLRHAILVRETEAAALDDIERSMADVTAELGAPCVTFAFPNGNYTGRLARHAMRCGARTVVTTDPMWADASMRSGLLPRVELSGEHSPSRIELKLAVAAAGRLLSNPDGTGRLYRRVERLRRASGPARRGGLYGADLGGA